MLSAALWAMLLTPGQAEKAVTIPDADLAAIGDNKHPKHKETADKYDGKLVRLAGAFTHTGGVQAGIPQDSYSWFRDAKGSTQVIAVEWSDTPGVKESKDKIRKAPRSAQMVLYGRLQSGGAGLAKLTGTATSEANVPAAKP